MKEIIQHLFKVAGKRSSYIRHSNTMVFVINDIEISMDFTLANDLKIINIENFSDCLSNISKLKIENFFISISESYEDREYLGRKDDQTNLFYYPNSTNSISNSLFNLVKKLFRIDKNLVINNKIKIDDPNDDAMCGYYPKYFGEIEIDTNFLNLSFLELILKEINSFKITVLNNLYAPAYYNYKRPKNIFEPQFINTNTKVRRLGYLKLFFQLIREKKKIPERFINKKYEDYSLQFSLQLSELSNKKGVIQNFKGKSAEPYISLLKEMDLITTVNRVVVPTKWLKTNLAVREYFPDDSSEVFILDKVDKIFFLEVILKKDFLYSIVILEFLFLREKCNSQDVINNFQQLLLIRIRDLLRKETHIDKKAATELREMEKRVAGWKKAKVYLEHIIMPRVNWFADLDLIYFNDNKIIINENGIRLLNELNSWVDIGAEYVANSSEFLKKFYPHIYAKTYNGGYGEYPSNEIILDLVDYYIDKSFGLFKTLAPNRVTSSQAFSYTKYCIYFKNGFSVSENFLTSILEEKFSDKYIYKFQPRYGDGYIQKVQS